jgi:phage terminase large subunit-like protein
MTDGRELLAGLVLDDGRRWGEAAIPHQRGDAFAVLEGRVRRHFQVRPRGASKTTDAAGVALALLVTQAPARSRSYCYAVDQDQAAELLDALSGFVARTPGLAGAVQVGASTVTVPGSGASLRVESSDAASSFGRRPWLVIVDELTSWPQTPNHRRLWGSVVSALPKRDDSRLLVLSMAGAPVHFARDLWQLAQSSAEWRASLLPGPCPWWDAADVAATRALLTDAEYRRYLLCEWVTADDALSTEGDVTACVRPGDAVLPPRPGVSYVAALDVGTRRDLTGLAVAHRDGGRIVVDRVVCWRPMSGERVDLADVEATVLRVCREYRARLVFDRSQAEQLTQNLVRAGVQVSEFVFSQAGANRLAKVLYVSLRDRVLSLPDDRELVDELQTARLVETGPGTVKLANPPGSHDDLAVAVSMCVVSLFDTPDRRAQLTVPTGRIARPGEPGDALARSRYLQLVHGQ